MTDPALLVHALYKATFGRLAEREALSHHVDQLESGVSPERLAEELLSSAEFQARHGPGSKVGTEFLTALYRDGLGREPDPEGLAGWLAAGKNGATQAQVLAAFAGSAEALQKALLSPDWSPAAQETATLARRDSEPTRNEILLGPVPREGRIIEIGASYNPIAAKGGGWNTYTLDHMTREDLIAKYRSHPGVDVNRIEEVDFVWTGGRLISAVPPSLHGSFDALIASHVIEHTPDLIDFLNTAQTLLKPSGVVVLAIPDKRYCFDYFQPLTTTGQVLEAHAEARSRHLGRVAFDQLAYAVKDGGTIAWGQHPSRGLSFVHSIEEAYNLYSSIESKEDYIDLHVWRFTPASFELMLLELARVGHTDWRVESATPAKGCEFYAWLRRGGLASSESMTQEQLSARRLTLLKRTLIEAQAQINWLIAGEPELAAPTTNGF